MFNTSNKFINLSNLSEKRIGKIDSDIGNIEQGNFCSSYRTQTFIVFCFINGFALKL